MRKCRYSVGDIRKNETGEEICFCELSDKFENITLGECLGNCFSQEQLNENKKKVEESRNQKGELVGYLVTSPGSKATVCFYVDKWSFNGDFEKPTFRPSMLINPNNLHGRDHFFVTNGKIEYLSDCEHELVGQTVEMINVI